MRSLSVLRSGSNTFNLRDTEERWRNVGRRLKETRPSAAKVYPLMSRFLLRLLAVNESLRGSNKITQPSEVWHVVLTLSCGEVHYSCKHLYPSKALFVRPSKFAPACKEATQNDVRKLLVRDS